MRVTRWLGSVILMRKKLLDIDIAISPSLNYVFHALKHQDILNVSDWMAYEATGLQSLRTFC